MVRSTCSIALVMALALGCAGRNQDVDSPDEPWVMEAEPTVFADATREPAAQDTVLVADRTDAGNGPLLEPTTAEPTTEAIASPLDGVLGEYRYSGGSSQRKSVGTAIDEVVDDMSVFARGIAKNRLTKANKVPASLEIANDGDMITVSLDGKAFTAALGGKSVRVKDQGQRSQLRYELRGDSLYMFLDGAEGDRINVFTPREDGNGVTMRVTIKSSKLPDAIGYRLSYRATS
jgi:hypothetical protein